ncbi:MAG TPA: aspartate/glutamate racemase family protein [Burkholderiales bacterium]|nr:aspartate/glutamate racemase family protein [Burkholderiales bacterium]
MAIKIGLMVPANNTTMEAEFLAWLPAGATCRTLRIPRQKGLLTQADIPDYVSKGESIAADFRKDPVDLLVYGCTAAGILAGPERDAAIAVSLGKITGSPVVTTASSMVASLRGEGAKDIALVTPYSDEVNARLEAFLAQSEIQVRRMRSLGAENVEALGAIGAREVAGLARETVDEGCDALFIACSQLPTRAIVGPLEKEFRKPVWSSIKATAWRAAQELRVPLRDEG